MYLDAPQLYQKTFSNTITVLTPNDVFHAKFNSHHKIQGHGTVNQPHHSALFFFFSCLLNSKPHYSVTSSAVVIYDVQIWMECIIQGYQD